MLIRHAQCGTLRQVEKKIVKNLSQQGLQPPIHICPQHHHDLGGVDTHSSGSSWNFSKISFGGGLVCPWDQLI